MKILKSVAGSIAIAFVVVDIALSTLFLLRNDKFTLESGKISIAYSFWTSQIDHCALVLFRSTILLGGLIGLCRRNTKSAVTRVRSTILFVVCICLTMAVYSPTKLLALAETTDDLRLPWFWALFGWNILASLICALIWSIVFGNVNVVEMDGGTTTTKVLVDANGDLERLVESEETTESGGDGGEESKESVDAKKEKEESKIRVKEATSIFWRLIKYSLKEWIWYVMGFVFLFVYSAANIFMPYFTGRVISDVIVQHSYDRLLQSVLIMSSLALVSSVFAGLRGGCFMYAIAKMGTRLRGDLFLALVRQEIGFFDVVKTGDITSRLSADCQTVSDTVALNFNVFLRSSVILVGTSAFMFKLCWQLTVMTFIALPLIGVITKSYGQFYDNLSKRAQDSIAKANEVAEEVLSSMRTVRSFANELGESKRYDEKLNEVLDVKKRQTVAYVGYAWINELFTASLLIAVLWYGGHLVLTGRLKSENLISYLMYQLQMGESIMNIGYVFTGLMQAVGASRKVFEWIDRKPEISNEGQETLDEVRGDVEFKDVSFSYPSRPDVEVLKGINFKAKPGEVVALVGPSGGGKSSCIALLEHFYEPKSGIVSLDGIPVQNIEHGFFHRKVSLVSQEPILFARSITDNIAYGLEKDEWTMDGVVRASTLANAHQFIEMLPSTYETDVGEKGAQLSGGQKQRVAIARSLIRLPKVLLLDEATSALDAESEYLVKQALQQNLAGHTVILIAHRLSTVERADKIIVIDKGRAVQEGNHVQLLAVDGLYRNLVQRQLLGDHSQAEPPSLSVRKSSSDSQPIPDHSPVEFQGSPKPGSPL